MLKKLTGVSMTAILLASVVSLSTFPTADAVVVVKKKLLKGKIDRDVMMGDQLMSKAKFADAAEVYKQALNRNPKCEPAMVGLGMALAKQFKLDAATDQFNKALELEPRNPMALSGKAIVDFNRLQSSSATVIRNKDNILKTAESECKDGLAIDPGMPEAHYTLGMIYKEQGRVPEAISEFQEATKLDPQYSEAYSGLGVAQLTQNDVGSAMDSFKKAVEINSGNSTGHYGLGRCYLKQGQLDDAIHELNTSLAQYPNSAPARLAMGEAYNAQGNTVAAVKEFQESIRIKPENPDAYLHIADIRENRGDLEHSIAELRSGLELMPNNPDLRMRIGDESLKLEKLDDAVKEYETVMQTDPRNAVAAKGLTRALYLKANKEATGAFFVSNEFESAQKLIDRIVAMNPNDMELRLAQAKLRSMSGAPVDLASVGVPTNDGERIAYAEALLAQNKFKEANDQMNTVIGNATGTTQAFAVADLALMIKDLNNAEAAYQKASNMPGGQERSKRGLAAVAKVRDSARQDLTLADDLSRRKQLGSAIDKYHSSIYNDPKGAAARLGLAQTLEKLPKPASKDIRESIVQYKAYMALAPNLDEKEQERLNKKIARLETKASKLEQKEQARKTS
jgi:tetratricopeptide (TPR) repeat protein